jgi:glycolate oxidase FAD binding subunit
MTSTPSPDAGRAASRPAPLEPAGMDELAEVLARCDAEKRSVELGGNFSKQPMGGAIQPADVVVSTAKLARVVQYEPRDLTISVEAGLPFRALKELLAQNNQMLPLDPPDLGGATTIGGALAANCSGPRRRLYGSGRDMVIGMTFVTLEGQQVRSGGMVVKNVAGLDMAKLLIGSFGTLAAMARVNCRLYPRPPQEKTFLLSFASVDAALKARDAILRSVLQPAAIDLANPPAAARLGVAAPAGYVLALECGGIDAVMARYERELKAIARDAAAAEFVALGPGPARGFWQAARDFPALGLDGPGAAILRLPCTLSQLGECFALAGQSPALARAGSGVTYLYCNDSPVDLLARARAAGLHTVVESCSPEDKNKLELWADPGPELEVMSRIKQALDPHHLLNHGRLYNRL